MAFLARALLLCAAFFAVAAPLLCALPQNEIQITLYIHQSWGDGPTKNEAKVVQGFNNTRFGETWVHDWPVRDRPDLSANVIGRAQGFQIKSTEMDDPRRWYMSTNLVFSDESKYAGSTLQIIGFTHSPDRTDWSIVGGTGDLTLARGVAKYTFVETQNKTANSNLYKVNVHAYYSSMDSTTVCGKSGCNSKIIEPIAIN